MACQTGIKADKDLINFFETCKQSKIRIGKIVINKEKLCVNFHAGPSNDWRADWKKYLPELVDSFEPCFILFRFESNHDWILISFSDDKASVRDKMVLAATKATFKSEFGHSFIRAEYQVSNRNDLILETFEKRFLTPSQTTATTTFPVIPSGGVTVDDSKPYTHIEREFSTVARDRPTMLLNTAQTIRGVQFPIDQDAFRLLNSFGKGEINFIQLSVDTLNEAIKLESHEINLDVEDLSDKLPKKKPKYSLFRFIEFKDKPVFFIYSVPPSSFCTIKELMLFSSCKAPFLTEIQSACGVKITKKIEVDSRDRLDGKSLASYIAPETVVEQHFSVASRPSRPGSGPRRLVTKPVE